MDLKLLFLFLVFGAGTAYKLVCYHTNWSQYRPGDGKYYPENIDANLCTHIIYSFGKVTTQNRIEPYEWNDKSTDWMTGMYERTWNLKQQNPSLKILIAVGGWNHDVGGFYVSIENDANRRYFANEAIAFLRRNNFDGLDIDWEYPGGRGSPTKDTDKANFVLYVKVLKEEFEKEAAATGNSQLLLTAAVPAGKENIDNGYNVPELGKYFDFINLMSYDLHGAWENTTGHNSPLHIRSGETGRDAQLNQEWATNYWLNNGLSRDKLILGLATYGRAFTLTNPAYHGLGAPTRAAGAAGTYTREAGFLSYYEICQNLNNGWRTVWNDEHKIPYAFNGDQWVGYDNILSLQYKTDFIISKGLGGGMIWALDLDDFSGRFCGQGSYPLINAVKYKLNGGTNPIPTQQPTTAPVQTQTTQTAAPITQTTKETHTNAPGHGSGEFSCDGKADGFYADPKDCSGYYICNHGVSIHHTCKGELRWNSAISACDWETNVKC